MKNKTYYELQNFSEEDKNYWQQAIINVKPIKCNKEFNINKELNLLNKQLYIEKIPNNDYDIDFRNKTNKLHTFDKNIIRNIKNNSLKIERYIDLHGYSSNIAANKIMDFIIDSYNKQLKLVQIITGKGKNSKYNNGILKNILKQTIEETVVSNYVISYADSLLKHGGLGAYYVLLKKNINNNFIL